VDNPAHSARLCPSARCGEGATLLGVVGPEGRVVYITPALAITREFATAAQARGRPEAQFRFADQCVEGRCVQWTGSRCGVIDELVSFSRDTHLGEADGLPACSIRGRCRWFAQSGAQACAVCPLVVTDARELVPITFELSQPNT